MRTESFDAVVIGGGPAGSTAAAGIAGGGFPTLILEKRDRIGFPVRCAEAIGPASVVRRHIEIFGDFVSSMVDGVRIVAPDKTTYEKSMPGAGYTVDRELFDRRLADIAVEKGAELRTGHQATGLIRKDGLVAGVMVRDLARNEEYEALARVVVGADGVESLSPRWASLKGGCSPGDILSCAQELVEGIDVSGRFAEFHLGRRLAPGGYAWVFPKGPRSANVGLGINPLESGGMTAVAFLERFLAERCPGALRRRLVVGGSTVAKRLRSLATAGYVAVGEAANQNNPLTGGGILESIAASRIAASVIRDALENGDTSAKSLGRYTKEWDRTYGRAFDRFHRAARVIYGIPDPVMNRLLENLGREKGLLGGAGIDPARILGVLLRTSPSLFLRTLRVGL